MLISFNISSWIIQMRYSYSKCISSNDLTNMFFNESITLRGLFLKSFYFNNCVYFIDNSPILSVPVGCHLKSAYSHYPGLRKYLKGLYFQSTTVAYMNRLIISVLCQFKFICHRYCLLSLLA